MNIAPMVCVLPLLLTIISCSSNNATQELTLSEPEDTAPSLAGKWHITSFTGRDGSIENISARAEWALSFNVDNSIQMQSIWVEHGPCDGYSFEYTFNDNTLTRLGDINSPDGGCTASASIELFDEERLLNQMFRESKTFTTDFSNGESLSISSGFNEVLHLKKEPFIAENIIDRLWTLDSVIDESGTIVDVYQEPGFEFTLQFSAAVPTSAYNPMRRFTEVVGINVCNHFGGGYAIRGFLLGFTQLAHDDQDCERALEPVPRLVNQVLQHNGSLLVDLSGDTLTLESSTDILLVYKEL